MPINGEDERKEEEGCRQIQFICDVAFGALQGIVDEFTEHGDDETANMLMEQILRNAWERLGDCEHE